MSIASVVTRGYGSFGDINLVVTRGFTVGAAANEDVPFGWGSGYPKNWREIIAAAADAPRKKREKRREEILATLDKAIGVAFGDKPAADEAPLPATAKPVARAAKSVRQVLARSVKALPSFDVEGAKAATASLERSLERIRASLDAAEAERLAQVQAAAREATRQIKAEIAAREKEKQRIAAELRRFTAAIAAAEEARRLQQEEDDLLLLLAA